MTPATGWFIDLRAWSHGGPVGTLKVTDGLQTLFLDHAPLLKDLQGRDVLFVTHGFENNRQQGINKIQEWKRHLALDPMPLCIGVLWPGDCVIPIAVDYIWEGSEAQKSGALLGQFLAAHFGQAQSLSFVSHSLGVRVVLEAIAGLQGIRRVRHLYTMAAAIEDDTLTREFVNAARLVDHISVIYSEQDRVLAMAYPAGNLVGGLLERDDPNIKAALGLNGPLLPVNHLIGNARLPDPWQYGHTDYLTENTVYGDFPPPLVIPAPEMLDARIPVPAQKPVPADLVRTAAWKPCWSANFFATRWPRE